LDYKIANINLSKMDNIIFNWDLDFIDKDEFQYIIIKNDFNHFELEFPIIKSHIIYYEKNIQLPMLTNENDVLGKFISLHCFLEVQTFHDHNEGMIRYGNVNNITYAKFSVPLKLAQDIINFGRKFNKII
jgi:hypothetical protein